MLKNRKQNRIQERMDKFMKFHYFYVIGVTGNAATVYVCNDKAEALQVSIRLQGRYDNISATDGVVPKSILEMDILDYENSTTMPDLYKIY